MAKELPFFKWKPEKYITGDITLCSFEAQGVFANLISFYWAKKCHFTLANAKQRYSKVIASLDELLNKEIIKLDENENLIVEFLDEQMNEFENISEIRAKSGRKGGVAKAKQKLSKTKAKSSNIDKEEDKEEEYIYNKFYDLEIQNSNNNNLYIQFVKFLFETNPNKKPLNKVLKYNNQITFESFLELINNYDSKKIKEKILALENDTKGKYSSFNLTLRNWLKK